MPPTPKRSDQQAGHKAKSARARKVTRPKATPIPPASETWHPDAVAWYDSLHESGQSTFYEPSDWEFAHVLATMLSSLLSSDRPSAEMFKAIQEGMKELGVTEGARRRMRIEVDRPGQTPGAGDPDKAEAARKAVSKRFAGLAAVQ